MAPRRSEAPAAATNPLAEYASKRAFQVTPEPAPQPVGAHSGRSGPLLFVVQQHAARGPHFDLRLELDGVLKSWAVPKGMLIQPGEHHLAVPTEDHPFAYGAFEGVIPQGQYGAGTMIVWDCGLYWPDETVKDTVVDRGPAQNQVRAELAAGKLSIFLLGEKLKGSYALVRTKDRSWLLLKHRDRRPIRVAADEDARRSVLTPYAVANVSNLAAAERLTFERLIVNGPLEPAPAKLAPMLADATATPFTHRDWMFEPKLDGYRVVAFVTAAGVRLRSRNGLDLTAQFPGIVDDLGQQLVKPMVLDAEVVAFRDARPSFGALQQRARLSVAVDIAVAERATPCVLFCFDLLHALGINLRGATYVDRRRYLKQCLAPTARIQLVHADADGAALYRAAIAAGFEGMIAKRRASIYLPGRRSADWLKVKQVESAEFVVGGYTSGQGSRRDQLGALLLGAWQDGALQPVGNVGSGFDDATIEIVLAALQSRATTQMPFSVLPEADQEMHWARPELVAEVQFAGWTDDRRLRAPVFLRLRADVDPRSLLLPAAPAPGADAAAAGAGTVAAPDDLASDPSQVAAAVLAQLSARGAALTLAVGEHRIKLTNLDKPLWPKHGTAAAVTKRHLLQYLAQAAPFMLCYLRNRPLTVIRMPDGIHGEAFFQKHWERATLPPFVRVVELVDDEGEGRTYVLANNLETLLWLGQMGTIEFHAPHASVPADDLASAAVPRLADREVFDRPDFVVFDLDPYIYSGAEAKGAEPEYNPRAFAKAREVAFHLRELLTAMSLQAFVKTTGKTGLHIFVPIERTIGADQARDICRLVGEHLLRLHPKDLTMDWAVEKRTGRIFFDHNMNGRGRTLNAAYSPRRVAGACVATPVTWEDLATVEPVDLDLSTVAARLRDNGDPWGAILDARHDLTRVFDRAGSKAD
jgi:bifunctional non-homologous end joining protein LigD